MNCIHCGRPAIGTCKFCGRGVCPEHKKSMPYVINIFRNKKETLRSLVTEDVLYCGMCKPAPKPVDVNELDG